MRRSFGRNVQNTEENSGQNHPAFSALGSSRAILFILKHCPKLEDVVTVNTKWRQMRGGHFWQRPGDHMDRFQSISVTYARVSREYWSILSCASFLRFFHNLFILKLLLSFQFFRKSCTSWFVMWNKLCFALPILFYYFLNAVSWILHFSNLFFTNLRLTIFCRELMTVTDQSRWSVTSMGICQRDWNFLTVTCYRRLPRVFWWLSTGAGRGHQIPILAHCFNIHIKQAGDGDK
jgi:hypothetical protein